MPVDSVTPNSTFPTSRMPTTPEAREPRRIGPDGDGDGDDRPVQSGPVVNTSGQPIGLLVNDKA